MALSFPPFEDPVVDGLYEAKRATHARELVHPAGGRLRGAARVVRGPRVELAEIGPRRPLALQEELHNQVPEAQRARVVAFDGRGVGDDLGPADFADEAFHLRVELGVAALAAAAPLAVGSRARARLRRVPRS